MTVAARPRPVVPAPSPPAPAPRVRVLLREGDRLTQEDFHRLYSASPPDTRAELIDGVVYMGSPLHSGHTDVDDLVGALLVQYRNATPGIHGGGGLSTILGSRSEVQPDYVLFVKESSGGRARIRNVRPAGRRPSGPLVGPPELVIEVSDATLSRDLSRKMDVYRAAGVLEYLVFDVEGERLFAFDLAADVPMPVSARGTWKSRVFAGLWVDGAALFEGKLKRALAVLNRGLASDAGAAFVKSLAALRRKAGKGGGAAQ